MPAQTDANARPPSQLHPWTLSIPEAAGVQRDLAGRVVAEGEPGPVRLVAGVDVGYRGVFGRAAVAVLSYPALEPVETARAELPAPFPYVPGFLSFREAPTILAAFERLTSTPDLILVDGQGIAHPRRFGVAAHLGLLLDLPTIGCAKSRLIGTADEPADERGAFTLLRHRGETIGAVVRTRPGVSPIYVSVGQRIGLEAAIAWTLRCTGRYRLPEPIRAAHRAASARA